jgi:hypothetical protein
MKRYEITDMDGLLVTHGRTYLDNDTQTLFFNWSVSGVELTFCGTRLTADFCADFGEEVDGLPWDETAPRRKTWPWVAVFLDSEVVPAQVFEVSATAENHLIFESETPQTHRIQILKRTENTKTYIGINAFLVEGEFLPMERSQQKRIEFIGDSITCGFGNESTERDRGFYSAEEDGYLAYGPRAARQLHMNCSCVCISGISAVKHKGSFMPFSMDELYLYTDKPHMTKTMRSGALEQWDFSAQKNDYVVVNLGVNDAFAMLFGGEDETVFNSGYLAFIKQIRACNGPDAIIVCALGSMNYFLWHNIVHAVEAHQRQTGDSKICCYKFQLMHPFDGFGAAGHPSMSTHKKMADEITDVIQALEAHAR